MKMYSIVLILFVVSFYSNASASLTGVTVGVEITFGRHYPTCDERGLCRVKIDVGVDKLSSSFITLDEKIGTLSITTTQKSIIENQPDKLPDFQGKQFYDFIENWVAPEELNKALKATKPIIIKAGSYPMTFKDGKYTIVVKL